MTLRTASFLTSAIASAWLIIIHDTRALVYYPHKLLNHLTYLKLVELTGPETEHSRRFNGNADFVPTTLTVGIQDKTR